LSVRRPFGIKATDVARCGLLESRTTGIGPVEQEGRVGAGWSTASPARMRPWKVAESSRAEIFIEARRWGLDIACSIWSCGEPLETLLILDSDQRVHRNQHIVQENHIAVIQADAATGASFADTFRIFGTVDPEASTALGGPFQAVQTDPP